MTVATPGEWQCKTAARSGEWAQHFSNASCLIFISSDTVNVRFKVRVRVRFNNSHVAQILYSELFGNAKYFARHQSTKINQQRVDLE